MSEFTDEIDGCDVICPYCGNKYQREGEDYDQDSRVEECEECGKKYRTHDSFSVEHHTEPDCTLNGEDHQYEKSDGHEAWFCEVCGDCKIHDPNAEMGGCEPNEHSPDCMVEKEKS